ncbi:MAG TPA: hypothetical protein VEJ18_14310 [Planctomycetota bacterium]|nr:hypothetical protein [Planctomycetota bacterium]
MWTAVVFAFAAQSADERAVFAVYYPGADDGRELREMARAGIDVALVVADAAYDPAPLAAAADDLRQRNVEAPRLAPCLAPAPGLDVAAVIRRFYDVLPPPCRAVVDDRPLLWLLPGPAGAPVPPVELDGRKAFVVADRSWTGADRVFAWGKGPLDLDVVSVRPVGPRGREDGQAYDRAWYAAHTLGRKWVVVETWNGREDGVSEGADRGRGALEATLRHARKHKTNQKTDLPKGKYTGQAKALFTMRYNPREQGLRPVDAEDGAHDQVQLRGVAVLASKERPPHRRRCLYFDVDDSFWYHEPRAFDVEVEFLDVGEGALRLEYDAADRRLALPERHAKSAGEQVFTATGDWKSVRFELPDALFGNNLPGGADFRLVTEGRGLILRRVAVHAR